MYDPKDPRNWDFVYLAPRAMSIDEMAKIVLIARRKNPQIAGFLFNEVFLSVGEDDTVRGLVERYREKR